MKHFYLIVLSILLLCSCKNAMLNAAFQRLGVYDDKVTLVKTVNESNEVVFIPMKHLGTEIFYNNVKKTVDSLTSEGFFFYTEMVKMDYENDTLLRKFRRIISFPLTRKGYLFVLDSIHGKKFNIKLKKEIINQPSYYNMGVDSLLNKNVDVTLNQLIGYFENKNGEITLKDCDFETTAYEETNCKDKKVDKELKDDMTITFRNNVVLDEIDTETRNKIAIIYGEAHVAGILEGLKERGYQLVDAPPE